MPPKKKNHPLPSVLIDTPVWQDYFRKEEHTFREVNALMDAGRVCCLDMVVAELLQTAETEKERKIFQDFARIFPLLREPSGSWVEAARLSFKLRRKGTELPLRDCYVAVLARAHRVLLYTTNKALHQAQKAMDIGLDFFPKREALA
jgi:predicted nucleic acid-binding protein